MKPSRKKTLGLSFLGILFVTSGLIVYFNRNPIKLPPDVGTVLVYEIDDETLPGDLSPAAIAEALRSRVDPFGYARIAVRPLGARQLEMRIPRREDHENRVEDIKELVGHAGHFEFRILANEEDDLEAVNAARKYFVDAKTELAIEAEIQKRNETGKAPPPPPPAPTQDGFVTKMGVYQYEWLKLGRHFQKDLRVDDIWQNDRDELGELSPLGFIWQQAAEAREKGIVFQRLDMPGRPYYFCRTVHVARRESVGKPNRFEYFVLARTTEAGRDNPGSYIERALRGVEFTVHFHLSKHGGDLLGELTEKNVNRQMACVLDGCVMSTANIQSKCTTDGEITGRFTDEQVTRLVAILRAGPLPASLKPIPVSEKAIKQWWRIW